MATPTKSAQFTLDTQGQDFLQLIKSGGGVVAWIDETGAAQGALATGGSGTPGGTDTAIQFNNAGSFGGDAANFSWDDATGSFLALGGASTLSQLSAGPTGSAGFTLNATASPTDAAFINTETGGTMEFESDGPMQINSDAASVQVQDNSGNPIVEVGGVAKLGFYGATIIVKPTVTGAKAGNAALTSLIAKLVALGLITDGTS